MANDLIRILLEAELNSTTSITNIENQLKEISGEIKPIEIKFDLDQAKFKDLKLISEQLQKQMANTTKMNLDTSQAESGLQKITYHFKGAEEQASRMTKTTKDGFRTIKESIDLVNKSPIKINITDDFAKEAKAVEKEVNRITRLGENIGSINSINFKDNEAIKKYALSLQDAGAEITRFSRGITGAGQEQVTMTVRTQQTNNMVKEQKLVVDQNTQALYKQSEALKPNVNRMLGWAESMKVAITKSTQWAISMSLLYGNLRKLKDGVQYIKDLEHQTQQIQMVTKMTTAEVNELVKSYSALAQELSVTTLKTTEAAMGFFRQGLNKSEVEDRLKSSIQLSAVLGQSLETTAEQITAGVNSLGIDAERLGDVVTRIGAVAGTSGQELLKIIQLAGSTAKQGGMTLEELASMGAVISESTRLSAETIGNSLNTIIAKFQQVDSLTGEINEDYGKIIQAMESIGVSTVDKTTGQLRNINDILVELGQSWDTLDKKTQNYITTTIGVRQFNRFASLLGNIGRQQELLVEGQNSQNEMAEQYAVYLTKVESAAERTQNALQTMWSNTINPQFLRQFYDASTSIIQFIDKIGLLKVAVFTLSTVILLGTKAWKEYATSMTISGLVTTIITKMQFLGQVLTAVYGGAITAKMGFTMLAGAFDLVKVKMAAVTLGLSLLVTGTITYVSKLINAQAELKRANEELVQTYKNNVAANNDNIKSLKELSSEYNKIKDKIDNQISLNEEEKATLDELIKINPSLIQGYNERGEAIIDTTQSIKDMIKELERANEIEDIKLAQGGESFFKEATKDAKKYISELDNINFQISNILNGVNINNTERDSRGGGLTTPSLDALKEQYNSISEEERKLASGMELRNKIQDTELKLRDLQNEAKIYESNLKSSQVEIHNSLFAQARLNDSYKDLSSSAKSLASEYIRMMDVMDYKDWIEMQQAVDMFVEAMKNQDFSNLSKKYDTLVEEFKKGIENGGISAKEFDEKVKEIIESLMKIELIPEDLITKFFRDSSSLSDAADDINKMAEGWDENKQALDDLTKEFENITSKIQTYNVFLSELNSKEGLSAKSKQEIITKYQQLLPYIDDEKELRKQLIQIIEQEEKAQRQAYINMIMLSEDFFNVKIKGNSVLIDKLGEYYTKDLENAKSLAKAKELVENELIKNLSGKWAKYYNILTTSNNQAMVDSLARGAMQGSKEAAEVLKAVQAYKDVENRFNNIALEVGNVSFKDINMANVKDDKKKKSKEEQLAKDIEYNINLLRQQERALEDVRKQLTANKREQDIASEGARIRLKEKEIALIKEEQKALHNLANAARQVMFGKGVQIASDGKVIKDGVDGLKQQLEKTKLGFKFDASNFEIVNYDAIVKQLQDKVNSAKTKKEQDKIKEETDSVIKLADAYNSYLKVVQDASGQWLDKNVEIYKNAKEVEDAIKSLEKDLIDIKDKMVDLNKQRAFEEFQNDIKQSMLYLEPFANQLELLKTKFDLLSESDYDGKLDTVAEQFDASQRYGRVLRREFNSLSKTTTTTSQETDELINTLSNLQQQIKQNTLNTIEYQKTLDNLRIDQITSKFTDVNKELEKELNLVSHNLKMLEGGLLSGTDIVFGVDFALPTIPEDLIDKKRKENEELIREQRRYEKEILELKELSLEQQEKEQIEHYDKAMSELIGHYNDVLTKIKDYHGIESNAQFDHQIDVNNIISDGLTTTADNYNNTWAGIVSNLRGHLAEIEGMINQTNSGINGVTTKANTVASGGSGNRDRDRGSFDKQVERMKEHADYDRSNSSEIERISREHGVDTSVAREMDKTNKRTGTKMYAKGTDYHDGGLSLVGEIGEELAVMPNGKMVMLGTQGAELVDLPIGSQVIPHDETRKILSYTGNIDGEYIKQYKNGTKKYPSADELIRALRANDNFLFHYPGYDGSPVVAMNGDVYIEQRDGSYSYDREVWNDTRRDEKLRLLYGDMLKAKYPDSSYLKEYEMIENFIGSKSNGYGGSSGSISNTVRNQSLGSYYMGGSQDKNLPSDFKSYRENRSVNMEQIQTDQQKIIDDIAKGLDISTFREDLLKRIDEQLQEDVRMQFRLQDDLLKQQQDNAKKFMDELENEYLNAIDDEDVDKAKQLADKYNEASDVYLQTSEKIKNAIKDRYDYEFSLIDKKISKEKEIQDTYRTQLDILKELNKHNYGGFIQYNEAILQAENNKLALLQQSSKELQSQLNLLEVGSYEWNIVNERLDKINSSIQDTTLSIIKQNKEVLRQKYERELYNVEKSLFGGQTLDEARKELNDRIKYQNEYVGGLEKELMVSKIISDARKNNVELTREELSLLNQSGNIEKVKLERLEKQLSVRMLEQKLANLQNQKTIQQLTKKDDGTWDFAHVVDQDAIYNTEQELKNVKLDLIKWERDLDNRKKQEELDSKSQYLDELRKLTEKSLQSEYQSLSEFYMDANKITNEFYNEIGNSVHTTIDELANDFSVFLDNLDNFKSSIEAYDIPENSILGIVGEGSVVEEANSIINDLLDIQDKALAGQYSSFNDFVNDIGSLGDKLNEVYSLIWDNIVEKQLSSNDTLKVAYEDLLFYYEAYAFMMSKNTDELTDTIVNSSLIVEEAIKFMTEMVQQMVIEAEKASFSALESAETAAQAMISAIESARGASQAASDAAKSAAQAAASASNIANKMQTNQSGELNGIQSFNSGGYTGDFKNGKLAVLHEKELVLNKIDTQNLLKAVNITRDLFSNIKIPTIPKMQPAMASGDQVFHINNLELPNVTNENGAENLVKGLKNYALQFANKR